MPPNQIFEASVFESIGWLSYFYNGTLPTSVLCFPFFLLTTAMLCGAPLQLKLTNMVLRSIHLYSCICELPLSKFLTEQSQVPCSRSNF